MSFELNSFFALSQAIRAKNVFESKPLPDKGLTECCKFAAVQA